MDKVIQENDWNILLEQDHLELYHEMVTKFEDIYTRGTRKVKIKRRKPKNKWITTCIMELYCEKDTLWARFKQHSEDAQLKN